MLLLQDQVCGSDVESVENLIRCHKKTDREAGVIRERSKVRGLSGRNTSFSVSTLFHSRPSLCIDSGPGGSGLRPPEGSICDEGQAEEQAEGGPERSEDSGQRGDTEVSQPPDRVTADGVMS